MRARFFSAPAFSTVMFTCCAALGVLVSSLAPVGCSDSSTPTKSPSGSTQSDGGGGEGGTSSGSSGTGSSGTSSGSSGTAWLSFVGQSGLFGQTFDHVKWSTREIARTDLYSVTCVGNLRGWAAGANGYIAHTEDGGATWTAQDGHTQASLRSIRFGTPTLGIVAGDNGTIAVTADGGSSWQTSDSGTRVTLRGATLAANVGAFFVAGDAGTLLVSSNQGATWTRANLATSADLRGVATDAGGHLVLVVDATGFVWSSTDRGATFRREASAHDELRAVAMNDEGTDALAVGAHGTALWRSALGGWNRVATGTDAMLNAALVEDARGYAGGERGTLVTTDSRGQSWAKVPLDTDATLYGLEDL
jgi:photosystem II stability/assembly factor-like uncharacterized protein